MDSFYEISRGMRPGKQLTTAQRTSSKFAEEPVVMGKVLRANTPPVRISEAQYLANKVQLTMLEKAGAIRIKPPAQATSPVPTEQAIEDLGKAAGEPLKEGPDLWEGPPPEEPVAPPEPSKEEELPPAPEEEAKVDARPGKKGKKG